MLKNLSFFRQRRISLWLMLLLFISGCSSSKKTIIADALDAVPQVTGSVVNPTAFNQGGSLLLGSFEAGPNAAANDQTDQLSVMLVKGIKDSLPENSPRFNIVQSVGQSDFLLEGLIESYGRDTGNSGAKLRGNQVYLSISGDIWLRQSGERVLLFQSSSVIDLKTQNPNTVAYQMGVAIARYIGQQGS